MPESKPFRQDAPLLPWAAAFRLLGAGAPALRISPIQGFELKAESLPSRKQKGQGDD